VNGGYNNGYNNGYNQQRGGIGVGGAVVAGVAGFLVADALIGGSDW